MKSEQKRYRAVALETKRYEIEVLARRLVDAESLVKRLPDCEWTEDNEYYDFEIVEVSEVKD